MGAAGNGVASRVWKGVPILQIVRRFAVIVACLVVVGQVSLSAQTTTAFALNGVPLFTDARRGLSLGEIYPLLHEIDRLVVIHASGETVVGGAEAERSFFDSLFDGDLTLASRTFRDVVAVRVEGTPLESDRLSVWVSWEGIDAIEAEIRAFGERFGVAVETSSVANTRSKLTATERGRGAVADVVMIQADHLPDLQDAAALQPLRWVWGAVRDDPGYASFVVDGRLWAEPFYFDSHVVFYNPDLIPTEPPDDWTLADLERLAALSRAEVPLAWNAYSAYWLTPFVVGFGRDDIVGPDGHVPVDDIATHRALEYILGLVEGGALSVMERDAMIAHFTSGRAAFVLSGSYSIPSFEALGIPFGVAPFPRVHGGGRHVTPFLDFKGFAVARRAYHPVLARRFIQYMTSPPVQARVASQIGKMPADRSAWDLLTREMPYREALEESYRIGIPVPNERAYVVYKSLMWRMLRFAFTGQMSVDRVLEESDRLIRAAGE